MGSAGSRIQKAKDWLGDVLGGGNGDVDEQLKELIKTRFGDKITTVEGGINGFSLGPDEIQKLMGLDENDAKNLIGFVETASQMSNFRQKITPPPKDGEINYRELASALTLISQGSVSDKMTLLFSHFDTRKAENIEAPGLDKEELQSLFDFAASMSFAANIPPVKDANQEEIEQLKKQMLERKTETLKKVQDVLNDYDKDKSGKIEVEEFLAFAHASPEIQQLMQDMEISLTSYKPYSVWKRPGGDKNFRILSLDGGGVKGIGTIKILQRLEEDNPGFIDSIDMFAGTSTGAVIASLLAVGTPLRKIEQQYDEMVPQIFSESRGVIGQLASSKYDNVNFKRVAENAAGHYRLKDVKHKKLLMPTVDMSRRYFGQSDTVEKQEVGHWGPVFTHNFRRLGEEAYQSRGVVNNNSSKEIRDKRRAEDDKRLEEKLSEAVLKSAAAPVYLPSYDGHVDGGLVCNNPSLAAIYQATHRGYEGTVEKEDVILLSIGTGIYPKTKDEGIKGASDIVHILEMIMDSGSQFVDGACWCTLHNRYFRFQPVLSQVCELDDFKAMPQLKLRMAELNYKKINEWLEETWFLGQAPSTQINEKLEELRKAETPKELYERLTWTKTKAEHCTAIRNLTSVYGKKIGLSSSNFAMPIVLSEASGMGLLVDVIHMNDQSCLQVEGEKSLALNRRFSRTLSFFQQLLQWNVSIAHKHEKDNIEVLMVFDLAHNTNLTEKVFLDACTLYCQNVLGEEKCSNGFEHLVSVALKKKGLSSLPSNLTIAMDMTDHLQSTFKLYPAGHCDIVEAGLEKASKFFGFTNSFVCDRAGKIRWAGDSNLFAVKRFNLHRISQQKPPIENPKKAQALVDEYRKLLQGKKKMQETEKVKLEKIKQREQAKLEKKEKESEKSLQKFIMKIRASSIFKDND